MHPVHHHLSLFPSYHIANRHEWGLLPVFRLSGAPAPPAGGGPMPPFFIHPPMEARIAHTESPATRTH